MAGLISFRAGYSMYNWLDQPGMTFLSDTEALTAPASNLATAEVGVPWIAPNLSLTGGQARVTMLLGREREIQCLGFVIPERVDDAAHIDFDPALSAADAVRWRFSSTEEPASPGDLFDSDVDIAGDLRTGIDETLGVHGLLLDAAVAGVVRVDLSVTRLAFPAAPLDELRIGRAWLGPFNQFMVNHGRGAVETSWPEDELGHMVRGWRADFRAIRDAELQRLWRVQQQVGTTRQIFWWPRADRPSSAFIARFVSTGSFRARYNNAKLWSPALQEDWLGV